MPKTATLRVDSFTHSYGDKKILNGAHFSLSLGKVAGLLGKNGCGKSTLLKCVFGSIPTRFGTVKIDEEFIADSIGSGKIAYLSQESFLPQSMSVKKTISLFLDNKQQRSFPFDDSRLASVMDLKIANLSGGEKRYLEFNLIMALGAPFILLDEPFSEIEPIYTALMIEKIKKALPHHGFVITDHDYRNVLKVSNTLFVMQNGQAHPVSDEQDLVKWGYIKKPVEQAGSTYTERREFLKKKLEKERAMMAAGKKR